jgi:hypothetical protein
VREKLREEKNRGKKSAKSPNYQQEAASLSLPQLNRLFEASFARDENSASKAGVPVIPSQFKVT